MTVKLSPEELKALLDQGNQPVTVVDVRRRDRFAEGHVPGALHIPLDEIKKQVPDLPKDHLIVTYCGGGTSGPAAAEILAEHGYNVRVMAGFRAWKAANMPVETA